MAAEAFRLTLLRQILARALARSGAEPERIRVRGFTQAPGAETRMREPLLKKKKKEDVETLFSEGSVGATVTLLCSGAIGAGVLALPYGVSTVGVLPASVLFALAGAAAYVSNLIIFQCVQETGLSSYGELMASILGSRGALVLDLFVCLEGLAAVAAYLIFIMDYAPQVCELAFGEGAWCTDRTAVLTAASMLVWPLSCLKGLSALRYVSTCSLATVCFTSLVVVIKAPTYFSRLDQPLGNALSKVEVSIDSWQALSMACFAFMTHTNTPEIAKEFKWPTRERCRQVVIWQTALLWFAYSLIAVCGYLSFLDSISQDFLTDYEALFNVLEGMRTTTAASEEETLYATNSVRVSVTTACFAVVVGVALRTPHIADLISAVSVFLSCPLMFLFPAMMHRTILGRKDVMVPGFLCLLTLVLILGEIFRMAGGGAAH